MADNTIKGDQRILNPNAAEKASKMEAKISQIKEGFSEIVEIRKYLVEKNLNRISKAGTKDVLKSLIPAILVLILSLYIDVARVPVLGNVAQNMFTKYFKIELSGVTAFEFWWLPFAAFALFMVFAWMSNVNLKKQITLKGPSGEIITRIVDNYSGLVDSIATAMPLLGAAILLLSTQLGKDVFLGFSVPFEIKSIVILAIGKLFGAVFETQGLQYQAITEDVKDLEEEYTLYNEDKLQRRLLESIRSTNEQLLLGLTGAGNVKSISKEEALMIFEHIKLTKQLNEEHIKNLTAFKNTVAEFGQIKLFDASFVNQMNDVINNINNTAAIVKKTSEYTEIMKANFETMKGFSAALANIKLPDSASLAELQKTAAMLNETAVSLKDSAALKSLDNLVYLAGKR